MAIAPRQEQLNSAPAILASGTEVESADQLLAEVRAKIETQLKKTESKKTESIEAGRQNVVVGEGKAVISEPSDTFVNARSETLGSASDCHTELAQTLLSAQSTPALAQSFRLLEHAQSLHTNKSPLNKSPLNRSLQASSAESPQLSIQSNPPAFETLDVQKMAAEGYFQAIAYWLNEALIPQNVYAKVLADDVAGRIKVLVEFERTPQPKRLVRFVCDRLYCLNSNVIKGVRILARPVGAVQLSWEKSIRIPTAEERQQRAIAQSAQADARSSTRPNAKIIVGQQFKLLRAALVCGSAFLALAIGSFFYLFLSDRVLSPVASRSSEAIAPWYGQTNEPDIFQTDSDRTQSPQATAISFRPASRFLGRTVEAAFETVAVIPHKNVANPSDPTVTLMFGGELAFNDFTFKDTADLDNLFSEIDIYAKADVAMVSLAEPLAHASTSLQENFYQRTRPQATQALKSGGIDIVGLAGDGSMAHGSMGLSETLSNLDRQGIYRIGAGRNQQEAHRPEILEVKGQRIAYFGYSSDALKLAEKEKAGVALNRTAERSYIQEDIEAVRDQVDWVVVNYRWGEENAAEENAAEENAINENAADADVDSAATADTDRVQLMTQAPADWQQALAHEAVDAGADLVVGSHPTQIQGVEVYRDRPIAYSLGNFAFSRNPETDSLAARDTAALKVSLRNQRMKVELLPVTLSESKLQRASGQQGTSLLQAIRNASQPLAQPLQFPAVLKPDPKPASSPTHSSSETVPSEAVPLEAVPAEAVPTEALPADPSADWLPAQEANPVPESPNAMPGVVEVIQAEPDHTGPEYTEPEYTEPEYTEPAPNPIMKESEALFMHEENRQEADVLGPDSSEPHSHSQFDPDVVDAVDTVLEPTPAEAEMHPWQDPFAQDDSLQPDSLQPDSLQPDSLQPDSLQDRWEIEEGDPADDSIRPYAEPLVGPLSSTPTPFSSNL